MICIDREVLSGIPVLNIYPSGPQHQALPTVIFYHGWTNHKESVLVNGYEVAVRGMRAILPEALLHGERAEPGKKMEEQVMRFWEIVGQSVAEFPRMLAELIKKGDTDKDAVGVSGLSMGGITTCALMAVYPQIKAGVCLMGSPEPFSFGTWLVEANGLTDLVPKDELTRQLARLKPIDLSLQPEKIAGRAFHFWHGKLDTTVPLQPTFDFYQRIKAKTYAQQVTFNATEKDGHKVPYDISVEMATFFQNHLGKI